MTTNIQGSLELSLPRGSPLSMSVSKAGVLFIGTTGGDIFKLITKNAGKELECAYQRPLGYITSSATRLTTPIALDARDAEGSLIIGDSSSLRIFELKAGSLSLIAGDGQRTPKDSSDSHTASFDSIRSVIAHPDRIIVLTTGIRIIDRKTGAVSTLCKLDETVRSAWLLHDYQTSNTDAIQFTSLRTISSTTTVLPSGAVHFESNRTLPFHSIPLLVDHHVDLRLLHVGKKNLKAEKAYLHVTTNTIRPQISRFRLHPAACFSVTPIFCPSTKTLYAVNNSRKLVVYPIDPSLLGGGMTFPSVTSLLTTQQGLQADAKITHKSSQTDFYLHRTILNRCISHTAADLIDDDAFTRIVSFIPDCPLPLTSIRYFLKHRYFSSDPIRHLSLEVLLHMCWLNWTILRFDDVSLIEALHSCLDNTEDAEICELLVHLWLVEPSSQYPTSTNTRESILASLTSRAAQDTELFKKILDKQALQLIASNPSSSTRLIPLMTSSMVHVLTYAPDSYLPGEQVDPLLDTAPFLPCFYEHHDLPTATDFAFICSDSPDMMLRACGWLLHARWPWFKRLVESGLEESKTRIVTLPKASFTRKALQAIVAILQTGTLAGFDLLEDKDIVSILLHAEAFELISLSGKPLDASAKLIKACTKRLFPPTTTSNCFKQAQYAHDIHSPNYASILDFINRNVENAPLKDILALSSDVIQDLKTLRLAS